MAAGFPHIQPYSQVHPAPRWKLEEKSVPERRHYHAERVINPGTLIMITVRYGKHTNMGD